MYKAEVNHECFFTVPHGYSPLAVRTLHSELTEVVGDERHQEHGPDEGNCHKVSDLGHCKVAIHTVGVRIASSEITNSSAAQLHSCKVCCKLWPPKLGIHRLHWTENSALHSICHLNAKDSAVANKQIIGIKSN